MTDLRANLPSIPEPAAELSPYAAPPKQLAVPEQPKKPPAGKSFGVRRRATVGTELDTLLPDMQAEAQARGLAMFKQPCKATVVRTGFAIEVMDPAFMMVDVTFHVVPDETQLKLGREYAALMDGSKEQEREDLVAPKPLGAIGRGT